MGHRPDGVHRLTQACSVLGPKQNAFVAEYLKDLNATLAAQRAGYSPKTAGSQGARLLANAKVAQAIAEAMARRNQRVEVTQDDVLRVLLRHLSFDVSEAFDEHGALLALNKMPDKVRLAVQSIEVDEMRVDGVSVGTTRKVKFWSKDKALELGMRHLGLFAAEKKEVAVTLTLAELVRAAMTGETPAEGEAENAQH